MPLQALPGCHVREDIIVKTGDLGDIHRIEQVLHGAVIPFDPVANDRPEAAPVYRTQRLPATSSDGNPHGHGMNRRFDDIANGLRVDERHVHRQKEHVSPGCNPECRVEATERSETRDEVGDGADPGRCSVTSRYHDGREHLREHSTCTNEER